MIEWIDQTERSVINAVYLHDLTRENVVQESPQTFLNHEIKINFPLNMPSNDDDRRQRRKQGGVVGAAASKTRMPLKA